MESAAPIGMLEQMRAIEVGKAVRVGREVRWHPVENHADATLMQVIHEEHEILRRTVTRGWSEVAGCLISPGRVKRMLHNREQFHVREMHSLDVVRQLWRDLAVSQRTVAIFWRPHPRT